jgi:hypothetical protein
LFSLFELKSFSHFTLSSQFRQISMFLNLFSQKLGATILGHALFLVVCGLFAVCLWVVAGVKAAVAQFQARGVQVVWPYFRWDAGTKSEGVPDYVALVEAVVGLGSDAFNGDTCDGSFAPIRISIFSTWPPAALWPTTSLLMSPNESSVVEPRG